MRRLYVFLSLVLTSGCGAYTPSAYQGTLPSTSTTTSSATTATGQAVVIIGNGYTSHVGEQVYLQTRDLADDLMESAMATVDANGTFAVTMQNGLKYGQEYTLIYYADHNKNGMCDAPPADHSWIRTFTAAASVEMDHSGTSDQVPVCSYFSTPVTIKGTGYTSHVGETIDFQARDANDKVVQSASTTVDANGNILVVFASGLEYGKPYNIIFYADHNKNGVCDPPPADHSWIRSISASAEVELDHEGAAEQTPVCDYFAMPVSLHGTGYTGHIGEQFYVQAQDANGSILASATTIIDANGNMAAVLANGLRYGAVYTVVAYVDHNRNNQCDPPPADHSWRQGALAAPTVEFDHLGATDQVSVCATFSAPVKLAGVGYTSHIGEAVTLQVRNSGGTVVSTASSVISSTGTLSIILASGVTIGQPYQVIYYVDNNKNGMCDAPPTDHSWDVSVTAKTTVEIDHTTAQTPVCSMFVYTK